MMCFQNLDIKPSDKSKQNKSLEKFKMKDRPHLSYGLFTEADKGQSQNIYEIRKMFLKSEKIFQIVMFFGSRNDTGVCSLCMIRVNCRSTLGVLAGMINP